MTDCQDRNAARRAPRRHRVRRHADAAPELDGRDRTSRVAAGRRRADRRRRDRHARRPRQRARRVALRAARRGRVARSRCGCARPRHPDRHRVERPAAGRGRLPRARASGSREPIGLAEPEREAQPALVRTDVHGRRAGRHGDPVLDGARRRRARAQRRPRSPTTCSRPAGRATATGSCTRPSMSPPSCARARTCSARRSPAPGTPRSTASSTFADRLYGDQPSLPRAAARRVRRRHASRRSPPPATAGGRPATAPSSTAASTPGEHQDLRRAAVVDSAGRPRSSTRRRGRRRASGAAREPRLRERPGARGADRAARCAASRRCRSSDDRRPPSGGTHPRLRPEPRRPPARARARRGRPAAS